MRLEPLDDAVLRLYKSPESYAKMRQFYDTNLAKYGELVTFHYVDTGFGKPHMLRPAVKMRRH